MLSMPIVGVNLASLPLLAEADNVAHHVNYRSTEGEHFCGFCSQPYCLDI